MDLVITNCFEFTVNSEEFRLISGALRGVLKQENIQAAKELGDKISIVRAKYIRQLAKENEKLIGHLKESNLWDGE